MIIHRGIEQGTDEWKALRLGKITGSRFSDVMTKGRGSAPSKTRESYMLQLIAETLTGEPVKSFSTAAMEWGVITEGRARAAYCLKTGNEVEQVSFIEHSPYVGVSPDGLIGDLGMVEFKCPETVTQLRRVLAGVFPDEYTDQVQGQLWVAEREWCDFVSYDPRIMTDADYFSVRVFRDEKYIKTLADECERFKCEMLEMLEKLK